jgi:hypothetical protein
MSSIIELFAKCELSATKVENIILWRLSIRNVPIFCGYMKGDSVKCYETFCFDTIRRIKLLSGISDDNLRGEILQLKHIIEKEMAFDGKKLFVKGSKIWTEIPLTNAVVY